MAEKNIPRPTVLVFSPQVILTVVSPSSKVMRSPFLSTSVSGIVLKNSSGSLWNHPGPNVQLRVTFISRAIRLSSCSQASIGAATLQYKRSLAFSSGRGIVSASSRTLILGKRENFQMDPYINGAIAGIVVATVLGSLWERIMSSVLLVVLTFILTLAFLFFVMSLLTHGKTIEQKGIFLCVEWGSTFVFTWMFLSLRRIGGL